MKTINIIQDEATPHNNILIRNLVNHSKVNLWYAIDKSEQYEWDIDLTNQIMKAEVYGERFNFKLIYYFLRNSKKEHFIMVGWGNPTTRAIFLLSCLFKLKLYMWFDLPDDKKKRSWLNDKLRSLLYFFLKKSNIHLFCVGKLVIDYFSCLGISDRRLHNLPVQVEVVNEKKINQNKTELKLFAGSRLTYDKGYDLLIAALDKLPSSCKVSLKIAGVGDEKTNLISQVESLGLTNCVEFIGWVSPERYQKELSLCDIFIHPARFDAYGATVIALATGTPVIGSNLAGAVRDCLIDGVNGYSYTPESIEELSSLIVKINSNRSLIKELSNNALKIAKQYDQVYWAKKVAEVIN